MAAAHLFPKLLKSSTDSPSVLPFPRRRSVRSGAGDRKRKRVVLALSYYHLMVTSGFLSVVKKAKGGDVTTDVKEVEIEISSQ